MATAGEKKASNQPRIIIFYAYARERMDIKTEDG